MILPLLALAAFWLACVGAGSYASAQKNRPAVEGALLGLVLGPVGLLVALLLPTLDPWFRPPKGEAPGWVVRERDRALARSESMEDDAAGRFLRDLER